MCVPDTLQIELLGMEFHAFHGCLPEEKAHGGEYVVDFRCKYPSIDATRSDSLADTLDYGEVYGIVAEQMAVRSDLLEHVAGRICAAIAARWSELPWFEVSIAKLNPPVPGPAASSRVTLSCTK